MLPTPNISTADQLFRYQPDSVRTELVAGRLIVREPAALTHGRVAGHVFAAIYNFVTAHALGAVYAAETGFTLARNPDTVRAPDVAFICTARLPAASAAVRAFPEMSPDLVVEVVSKDDRAREVSEKVYDWLAAGATLVWVIDPMRRSARVHRADGTETAFDESGVFSGDDLLPGFTMALANVLV